MNLMKNLAGGIAIMIIATLIGVAHNAARSKPIKLYLDLPATRVVAEDSATDAIARDADQSPSEADAISTSPTVTAGEFAAGEIPKERVKTILDAGTAIIIDAREESEFADGHIPGAINIPYDHFIDYYDNIVDQVPMDATVIVYCTSVNCDLGDQLAQELRLMGYEQIVLYHGGWDEWAEADYPKETSEFSGH